MTATGATPETTTIAALATPPGRGGIGVIRVSGPDALAIGRTITGLKLKPRHAHYGPFHEMRDGRRELIDQGIALYFPGPHSFTGEDVVEFQGHGGPVVMDLLLREILRQGVFQARPGQFTERAFLNDKIDLSQAEAVADLIESNSEEAARSALRSLQGAFSARIHALVKALIELRSYVEAAIDFPEEEIDFLSDGKVAGELNALQRSLEQVWREARQGSILREGMSVVIAGRPNAGKSSLLNALAARESAIVTAIEGTTRDVLREHIHIDGMPLHIIDTAGLRDNPDEIERIGIARALNEIATADRILLVVDSSREEPPEPGILLPGVAGIHQRVSFIRNKCDQSGLPAGLSQALGQPCITLSAHTGEGLELLREHLKSLMGYAGGEGHFTARRRHLQALERARDFLAQGKLQLDQAGAGELLADDLLHAQRALGEITGEVRADDLLGHIFSSFCIGK